MPSLNCIPLYLIMFWIAQLETGRSLFSFLSSKSCLRWERHMCQVPTFKPLPFLTKLCAKALQIHLLLTWGGKIRLFVLMYFKTSWRDWFYFLNRSSVKRLPSMKIFQFLSSRGFCWFAYFFVLMHVICEKRIRNEMVLECLHQDAQYWHAAVPIDLSWAVIRKVKAWSYARCVQRGSKSPESLFLYSVSSPLPSDVPFWC